MNGRSLAPRSIGVLPGFARSTLFAFLAFQYTGQRDGSWRLLFDYFPTNIANTTIQLRDPKEKDEADEA